MKTIIAGPRAWWHGGKEIAAAVKASGFEIDELVNGGGTGVDAFARWWAERNHIPVKPFRADWRTFGKRAGPIRNGHMAAYADALIVVKRAGEDTPGTSDMLRQARLKGMPIHVHEVGG